MRLIPIAILLLATAALADTQAIDRSGKWDVNGPLGPARVMEITVSEGTWMNLDVHPGGEQIVFDLLGDLYVMPIGGGRASRLTEGAAYDFQPRFSPDGSKLLFSSDRGSIMNAWVADLDGDSLTDIRVVSEQTSNDINGADWAADNSWIMARKRITDTSSIGIAELWLYHVDGGKGAQLISDKGEVDSFSASDDGRYIYYGAAGPFSYGRNPHGPVWSVMRYDRKTGEKLEVTGGNGSAATPTLSPDGNSIAFVRRSGAKSTLWLHDLATGGERLLWDGLDRDQIEGFGSNHIYPGFDWTPDGRSIVIWAGGRINRIDVASAAVSEIPFEAEVSLRYHEPLRSKRNPAPDEVEARLIRWPVVSPDGATLLFVALGHVYWMSLPDGTPQRLTDSKAFEFAPAFSADGARLAFTTWHDDEGATLSVADVRRGRPARAAVIYRSRSQLANPAFSADGEQLLVVAGSGANLRGGDLGDESRHDILLLNANARGRASVITSTSNRGAQSRITRPTFSRLGDRIWFFDDEATNGERGSRTPPKLALQSVKLDGSDKKIHMYFRYAQEAIVSPDESRVAFTELHNAYVTALPAAGAPVEFDPSAAAFAFQQLSQDGGEWVNWSAGGQQLSWGFGRNVHTVPVASLELKAKADPADAGDLGTEVIVVGIGVDGRYRHAGDDYDLRGLQAAIEPLWRDAAHARLDVTIDSDAPWSAWSRLNEWAGETKIAVKQVEKKNTDDDSDSAFAPQTYFIDLAVPRARPDASVALTGARVITMRGREVIEDATIVIENDRIAAAGPSASVSIPDGAEVFDISGKTVMPGLIDVHAHLGYGVLDINPTREWRYYANLAYGVTTTHDPSASTHTVFSQSEMVAAGKMVGPRIFSTGFILYGAEIRDKAPVSSYADALSHLRRLKELGAFSVKSYVQPRRDQRQWIIRAARAEDMLVVPEGGGDFPLNMGMIFDGHSGIEHALSLGDLYDDVITLFARSRSAYTATLLVAYGGQVGENWFYQHHEVWKNDKLQSFFPPRQIDARARRRSMSAEDDFNHKYVARHQKEIHDAGGLITLGAHGQLQGLGAHWEMWALTHGGMPAHDALQVATINGAEYLGMDDHLGSIEPGKLADLIVLERNPLEKIENSDSVSMTVINGVVYDANSMDQLWPEQIERGRFYFQH